MPKREKNSEKQANDDREHPKRETNAQRAAREDERRTTEGLAGALAVILDKCRKGQMLPNADELLRTIKRFKGNFVVAAHPKPGAKKIVRLTLLQPRGKPAEVARRLVEKPESAQLREIYTLIGREFCKFNGSVSEFLRLVADKIEGKDPHSSGDDWYDDKIYRAYGQAVLQKVPFPEPVGFSGRFIDWPTFSQFLDIFRRQNPQLHGASERSLRRCLKRLGYYTRPDKRGRPIGKRDRKPRFRR